MSGRILNWMLCFAVFWNKMATAMGLRFIKKPQSGEKPFLNGTKVQTLYFGGIKSWKS